jgi:hypothetical protein
MQTGICDCAEQFLKCYLFVRVLAIAAWMGGRTYGEEESAYDKAREEILLDYRHFALFQV